ncbi:MAG: lipase family protein [Janthinobacterium lividum]
MKFLLKSMATLLLVLPLWASEQDAQNLPMQPTVSIESLDPDMIHASLARLKAASQGLLHGFPLGEDGFCTFNQDYVYITFPGTQDLAELKPLLTNDVAHEELTQGRVMKWSHERFEQYKDILFNNILNYSEDFEISLYSLKYIIEGHSIGSVFTPLAALYIDSQKGILVSLDESLEIKIINYGPVFTFDTQAAEVYNQRFKDHHINFMLKEDKIPPFSTGDFSQENLVSFLFNGSAHLFSIPCLDYLNTEVPEYNFKPIGINIELSAEDSSLYQQNVNAKIIPTKSLNPVFTLAIQFIPIAAESIAKIWNAHQLDVYENVIKAVLIQAQEEKN